MDLQKLQLVQGAGLAMDVQLPEAPLKVVPCDFF